MVEVAGIRPHGSPCKSSRRRRQLMCAGTSAETPPSLPRVLFPQAAPKYQGLPEGSPFFWWRWRESPLQGAPTPACVGRSHGTRHEAVHVACPFEPRVPRVLFPQAAPNTKGCPKAALRFFGGGGGNRTRVRKPYTARTTCLARSFGSRFAPAGRQADAQPVASTDPRGQATKLRREAGVNDAAPLNPLGLRLACSSA